MIPYFDPVVVHLGPIPIHLFGVLVATGILFGVRQCVRRGEQLGFAPEVTSSMTTWGILLGFVVAHLFDVVTYQPGTLLEGSWWQALRHLINPAEGISSFGGFLGALVGIVVWTRRRRLPLLPQLDIAMYGLATGWFFGRLGCFSAHDHPGLPTHFFLGVDYGAHYPGGVRHDLGLYEAIYTFFLVVAFRLLARRPRRAGFYLVIAALTYAPVRFSLDFLRVADERYFGLTPAQFGSLAMFLAGLVLMWRLARTRDDEAAKTPGSLGQPPAPSEPSLPSPIA